MSYMAVLLLLVFVRVCSFEWLSFVTVQPTMIAQPVRSFEVYQWVTTEWQ